MKAYPITLQCRLLGVSTQAYYKHGDTDLRKIAEEAFCVEYIKCIRRKDRGIGGEKLWRMYRRNFGDGHSVGYNRFYDIMDKYHLKVRKRRRRVKTTDSDHNLPLYPNLVKELIPVRPNQLWVSDITYVRVKDRFCYVCVVIDLFSRRVLSHKTSEDITSILVWNTFEEAFERRKRPAGLTFHSDQGCQYTDFYFRKRLRQLGSNSLSPIRDCLWTTRLQNLSF